jgi:hypothetical protein
MMAKKTKTKADNRTPMQRMADRDAANDAAPPVPSDFTQQHGDYTRHLRTYVNHGGTPLARWRKAGMLSDSQNVAIDHCIKQWSLIGGSSGLVANLDRTVFGSPGEGNHREIDARENLHRMKGLVPAKHWDCFENVVRFDEPAGQAGSRLTENTANREVIARACVQFVADVIFMKERMSY